MTPLDIARSVYQNYLEDTEEQPVISTKEKLEVVVKDAMGDQLPQVKSINDLLWTPAGGEDEIIGDRFLARRGGLLFPAPTGIGKSTFVIQTMCRAALGQEAYGLRFTRPTKVLYVQAENDESDLAGMRDGVYEAAGFSGEEIKRIGDNLLVLTEANRTGQSLIDYLRGVVVEFQPAMMILDPIFSYLGGSASEQAMVSMFLRNMLNPMMADTNIACWLVHHTNKPPSGEQRRDWQGGEYAYIGSGSSEWANWARAILTIRQIGLDDVFELRAGKRGRRLGWVDNLGNPAVHRYIAHAKGSIHWQEADFEGTQARLGEGKKTGRPEKNLTDEQIEELRGKAFHSKVGAAETVKGLVGCGDRRAVQIVDEHFIRLGSGKAVTWKIG